MTMLEVFKISLVITFLVLITNISLKAQCYKLVWADEFEQPDSSLPDTKKWTFEVQKPGWVNAELQNYTGSRLENCRIINGQLIIEARKDNYQGYPYSSARIKSVNKGDWTYGRMEVRAKLPIGKGTWPAIWMMPTDASLGWPACCEIDIMEHVGYDQGRIYGTIHCASFNGRDGTQKGGNTYKSDASTAFHVYSIEWTPDKIDFYVDQTKFYTYTNDKKGNNDTWPYMKKFYMILNLAIGGSWGGAQGVDNNICPTSLIVDYVRVYQDTRFAKLEGSVTITPNLTGTTYTVNKLDSVSYKWTIPEGAKIIGSNTTNSIKVNWGCGDGQVKVALTNACSITDTIRLDVNLKKYAIAGKIWIPENATGQAYSIEKLTGATYKWTVDDGITIVSGQGTNKIVADFAAQGNVSVDVVSSCGTAQYSVPVKFGDGQFPYPDQNKPAVIPGKIIPANFDIGGEGVAYHDADPEFDTY